jgi:hypothetical protein
MQYAYFLLPLQLLFGMLAIAFFWGLAFSQPASAQTLNTCDIRNLSPICKTWLRAKYRHQLGNRPGADSAGFEKHSCDLRAVSGLCRQYVFTADETRIQQEVSEGCQSMGGVFQPGECQAQQAYACLGVVRNEHNPEVIYDTYYYAATAPTAADEPNWNGETVADACNNLGGKLAKPSALTAENLAAENPAAANPAESQTAPVLASPVVSATPPANPAQPQIFSCDLRATSFQCREYPMAANTEALTEAYRERCDSLGGHFSQGACPSQNRPSQNRVGRCLNIVQGKLLVKEMWLKVNYENPDTAIYNNHYYADESAPGPDQSLWNPESTEQTCRDLMGEFHAQ